MSAAEGKIAELHSWYCQRTRLHTKICFSQQLWFDRLRDYEYDAGKLREHCELIVRYLQREIARDKRNMGALKLSNFLQPDSFDADLALARLAAEKKRDKSGKQESRNKEPEPVNKLTEEAMDEIRAGQKAAIKTLRETLGGKR